MAVEKKKGQHSNYWLDRDMFEDDDDDDLIVAGSEKKEDNSTSVGQLMRLAAVRRAISNFVQILTGRKMAVNFSSGKESYTDGDSIIIAADTDPKKFDAMVGLALHEASHVLLSDFDFLKAITEVENSHRRGIDSAWWGYGRPWAMRMNVNVTNTLIHPVLAAILNSIQLKNSSGYSDGVVEYHKAAATMYDHIKQIMNILEDRRIDQYVYTNAQGYRPYYHELYKKYFFTAEIGRNLKFNPEWREITLENYINRMLLAFHPDSDQDALVGLKQLIDRMDLSTIERVADTPMNGEVPKYKTSVQFADAPMLWQEANILFAHMLQFAQLNAKNKEQEPMFGSKDIDEHLADLLNLDGAPQSPSDMQETEPELDRRGNAGKFNGERSKRSMETIKKVMNGEVKRKKIKKSEEVAIASMDEAAADLVDIKGEGVPFGNCLVTRKVTDSLLEQPWFVFSIKGGGEYPNAAEAVTAGRRMGAILENRLQVRNDPLVTKQTRLPQGGLDRRLLANLGMEITSVFQKSRIDRHRPAMLHLTLDASGSMSGKKWCKVVTVATALAYLGSKLRDVDVVITLRGGNDMPMVAVIFDSRKDNFKNYIRYVKRMGPHCATPEGLCFKATMDLILECTPTHQVYFINFSDGDPAFYYSATSVLDKSSADGSSYFSYGRENGGDHTRKMVRNMRDAGVKVLSYFIEDADAYYGSGGKETFKKMYGEDAAFCNVQNASEVLRTLNNLLLERGG
jgi:hypothetical protein